MLYFGYIYSLGNCKVTCDDDVVRMEHHWRIFRFTSNKQTSYTISKTNYEFDVYQFIYQWEAEGALGESLANSFLYILFHFLYRFGKILYRFLCCDMIKLGAFLQKFPAIFRKVYACNFILLYKLSTIYIRRTPTNL